MKQFDNDSLNSTEENGLDYGSDNRFFAAAGGLQKEPFKYPPREEGQTPAHEESVVEETSGEPAMELPQVPVSSEATAFEDIDSATMEGTYHAEGVGRRENAYDITYEAHEPQPEAPGVEQAPPERTKPGKKKRGLGTVAAVFALVGALAGGAATGYFVHRQNQQSAAQLQSQIDELKNQHESSVVINSASTPVANSIGENGLLNPALVYEQNAKSVVSVTTTGVASNGWMSKEFTSSGSGFILTENGYILTNYHVIEGYTAVSVTDHKGTEYEAEVVGYDALSDVALLKVEAEGLPAVTVGDSDVVAVGDQVVAIGNPLGELASTQTVGYVSAKDRMVNTDGTILNMLQTDAAINSGNSGGPLFNMYGQVIGITTAKYSGSSNSGATIEGIGFAIPINSVMELVTDLMEYGYITGQAYLGVSLDLPDPSVAAFYGLPSGPKVTAVEKGSCAERAGIQTGDFIIGLGDKEITSYSDLTYALRSYKAGDSSTITVFRAGAELTLDVTFDEKPSDLNTSQDQQDDTGTSSRP